MSGPNNGAVRFFYGTAAGRLCLQALLATHADRLWAAVLHTRLSRCLIGPYARRHGILCPNAAAYGSFADFFAREIPHLPFDAAPERLISPCDGWLSVHSIQPGSCFSIKNSLYKIGDILQDEALAGQFTGGQCLIFRLCPSDYHHYCYIDDGYQGENHPIAGTLHSVQPLACETVPVYAQHRRSWTLLHTRHFGPVVQAEIGALAVGGIVNPHPGGPVYKGQEKGHFTLCGSTIVLLLQPGAAHLLPRILAEAEGGEARVAFGQWIGLAGDQP